MHRRDLLKMNIAKMRYGIEYCSESYEESVAHFPDDPVALKSMFELYSGMSNTVIVKAPYSKESLISALKMLNFSDAEESLYLFQVTERSHHSDGGADTVRQLIPLYAPYEDLQDSLDHQGAILSFNS